MICRDHMIKTGLLLVLLFPLIGSAQQPVYQKTSRIEKEGKREFYMHEVQKGQTLYAISKLYEVSLDTIYAFNPEVKDGIKAKQVLRIPLPFKPAAALPVATGNKEKSKPLKDSVPAKPQIVKCETGHHAGPVKVAIMLPLYLAEIDSIPVEITDEASAQLEFKSLRFIQFYEGALIALDSVVSKGLSVNLHVYDINDDTLKTKKLLNNPELKETELIIGLLYGANFQRVAAFGKKNGIPVVNPLSNKKQHIEHNPYVFLANPTVQTMANQIALFMIKQFHGNTIILLSSNKEGEKRSLKMINDELVIELKKKGLSEDNIKFISSENDISAVQNLLSKTQDNVIVALSNDELFVASIMRYLDDWIPAYKMVLFGMPGWLDFKSVETKVLVDLNYHSFSSSFIDYNEPMTKGFIRHFRNIYKTEPQEFAYQGFDVTYYFLNAFLTYGKDFVSCIPQYRLHTLQTQFIFRKSGEDGFENTWLNIYKFKDYQVINARD
ncbi:MAG: ABC transporter substrate-binding protein [Bacteroidetes bacterium]|nr:ABC transporter substrate-binding protein [Bacteroidota bacterium]